MDDIRRDLMRLVGSIASEGGFKKRMRIHQGWWRAFVLGEPEGRRPQREGETVCSTITNGRSSDKNFLTPAIAGVVRKVLDERARGRASGMIDEERLFNNLLSSQPLCFNFFGGLRTDLDLATELFRRFYPDIERVTRVLFEYAPEGNYLDDNSAFDVALEVETSRGAGLIGIECKYTDSFSQKQYDSTAYEKIFRNSNLFAESYSSYTVSCFNQLFRNQLMAEAAVQHGSYAFAKTALFCHQDDSGALRTGSEFQGMLRGGENSFRIITYRDFIENMQRLDISWEQRELSMLLWARYCATELSKVVYEAY